MFVSVDPKLLSPNQAYDLLTGSVQPRPIAFVSTMSAAGEENLAPFSFFMAGGANPPSLMYSPSLNAKGQSKDSLRNVEETGEFVVNVVTRAMAEGMNQSSFEYPTEFSEWSVAGVTPLASEVVRPNRIAESPIHLECRLFKIIRHGDGPTAANYVIGEVVRAHVLESMWTGSGILRGSFRPISRLGGPEYVDLDSLEIFEMKRPSGISKTSVSDREREI